MKPLQDPDGSPRGARRRRLAAMAATLLAAFVVALLVLPAGQDAVGPAPAVSPDYELAQATNCETPAGVCQLPAPQPVGSLCQCPEGATGRAIL